MQLRNSEFRIQKVLYNIREDEFNFNKVFILFMQQQELHVLFSASYNKCSYSCLTPSKVFHGDLTGYSRRPNPNILCHKLLTCSIFSARNC